MHCLVRAAALTLVPALAAAQVGQNLVVNPSFEDGTYVVGPSFTRPMPVGWTLARDPYADVGQVVGTTPFGNVAHTGTNAFVIDGAPGNSMFPASWSLSQVIATTPGTTYEFSFWAFAIIPPAAITRFTFGDVTLATLPGISGTYQRFAATAVATGAATTLSFTGYNDPGYTFLDDVSVTALPAAVVPEPATWVLVGAGLAAVGAVARRRRGA